MRTALRQFALAGAGVLVFWAVAPIADHAGAGRTNGWSAEAQPLRNLIKRLRGETLPDGIVKGEGSLEAKQVDVSSKYAGRLTEILVSEGSRVTAGQVIGRVSSPEFEAQLRGAKSDLRSAREGLRGAESEIAVRRASLQFARADLERGQKLVQSGFLTRQEFDQRQRDFDTADAAVRTMTAKRQEAEKSIEIAQAKLQEIEAKLNDLVLVSPRSGKVQYQLSHKGEMVSAGESLVTILDLNDVYMTVYLPASETGRLGLGEEARVALDALPDVVIPAEVSFVASDAQFTPKSVETEDERAKLMFRVDLRIDRQVLRERYGRVETGLRGVGYVRTKAGVDWPADLAVHLPATGGATAAAERPAPPRPERSPQAEPPSPRAQDAAQAPPVTAPVVPPASAESPVPAAPALDQGEPARTPDQAKGEAAPEPSPPAGQESSQERESAPKASPPPSPPVREGVVAEKPAPAAIVEPDDAVVLRTIGQVVGAWAPSPTQCAKLFRRRGGAIAFREPIDQFAQAAIVEPQRIRLPAAICEMRGATVAGDSLKVRGECADVISYTSRTIYVRLKSANQLSYSMTGDPILATQLVRCPL